MYAHLANELVETNIVDVLFQSDQFKKVVHLGEGEGEDGEGEGDGEGKEKG